MFSISNNNLVNNIIQNSIINTLILSAFSKRFTKKDPVKEFLKKINYQCPICIKESDSGKAKNQKNLDSLRRHIVQVHKGYYDPITGLSYSNVLELLKYADLVLFLRIVS